MSIFFNLPIEQLRHLAATAKPHAKDKSSDLRNIYILHRHGRAYVIACDGHHAPMYVHDGTRDGQNSAYMLSWEDIETICAVAAKRGLHLPVELDEKGGRIDCGPLSCKVQKLEHCYLEPIFERFETCARRGKLIPSPAMHLITATQCRNIFPSKECSLEFLQEAGKPESPQFCTAPGMSDYCVILMPVRSEKRDIGKAIKKTRAFFGA